MSYLRLMASNLLQAAATTVPGFASGAGPDNLLNDAKVRCTRVVGGAMQLVVVLPVAATVRCVASAACNLTPAGTLTVRTTTDTAGVNQVSTAVASVLPGGPNNVTDAGRFPYGALGKFCVWLANPTPVRRVEITLSQPGAASVDMSHLFVGDYWESPVAPSWGVQAAWDFVGAQATRTQSGDLLTPKTPVAESLGFSLEMVPQEARRTILSLLRAQGGSKLLVALAYADTLDHDGLVYGRLKPSGFAVPDAAGSALSLDLEGW